MATARPGSPPWASASASAPSRALAKASVVSGAGRPPCGARLCRRRSRREQRLRLGDLRHFRGRREAFERLDLLHLRQRANAARCDQRPRPGSEIARSRADPCARWVASTFGACRARSMSCAASIADDASSDFLTRKITRRIASLERELDRSPRRSPGRSRRPCAWPACARSPSSRPGWGPASSGGPRASRAALRFWSNPRTSQSSVELQTVNTSVQWN